MECGQNRHWSVASWRACADLDEAAAVREYEEKELLRDDAAWEQVYAKAAERHLLKEPETASDRALRDNGERQLRGLTPSHLLTLGHLTCTGTGRVNRSLRSPDTVPLSGECAADLDLAGYSSNAAVVQAAARLFAALGDQVRLTDLITAYRGLRAAPGTPLATQLDRLALGEVFVDPGFVFAATSSEQAAFFQSEEAWWGESARDSTARPRMLTLEIREAICIPHPIHRSRELVAHLARTRRVRPELHVSPARSAATPIELTTGHLVLAPGSRWEVLSSGHSGATVALRQLT